MHREEIHVYLLPSQNKNNTYLELLKNGLRKSCKNVRIHELPHDDLTKIFSELRSYRHKQVRNIIHIQWPTVLYGSKFFIKSIYLILINNAIILFLRKFYHFKIIWTVHNFHAHDYPHPFIDRIGTRLVIIQSDSIICQQKKTTDVFKNRYPNKQIFYVPHGHYANVYGPIISKDFGLKRYFGFGDKDIVIISIGVIAPYKMNEKIIAAVQKARKKVGRLKLLIIGKGAEGYIKKLSSLAGPETVINNRFITNDEIARYFSFADYSIFYYDSSEMTSGALMLSLSYGVPVITRDIPSAEVINDINGHVFASDQQLQAVLEKLVLGNSRERKAGAIIESVKAYSWDRVGRETIDVYRK